MSKRKQNLEFALEHIKAALTTMQYGSITLVIQDNMIIQVEKNEKVRLK